MVEKEAGKTGTQVEIQVQPPANVPSPNPHERDVQFVVNLIDEEIDGEATIREKILSNVLFIAINVYSGAAVLFSLGILLLVWNTQPMLVALFTSVLWGLNWSLLPMFYMKHRPKRVISQMALGGYDW